MLLLPIHRMSVFFVSTDKYDDKTWEWTVVSDQLLVCVLLTSRLLFPGT